MTEIDGNRQNEGLSPMVEELSRSKSWLLLIAFGVYFLAAATLVVGILDVVRYGTPPDYGSAPASSAVIVVVLTSFLYVVPAIFLHRFARSISKLETEPSEDHLVAVLAHNTRFWRLAAIMMLIPIAIVFLALPWSL